MSFNIAYGSPAPADSGPAAGVVADNRDASDHKPIWARLVAAEPREPGPAR